MAPALYFATIFFYLPLLKHPKYAINFVGQLNRRFKIKYCYIFIRMYLYYYRFCLRLLLKIKLKIIVKNYDVFYNKILRYHSKPTDFSF